jgi:hypothetical protein
MTGVTPVPPTFGDSWRVSYPEAPGDFLAGHSNDQLAHIALELAAELWVVKRRLAAIEGRLVSGGVIASPDSAGTADEDRAAVVAERDAFVSRVFAAMLPEAR